MTNTIQNTIEIQRGRILTSILSKIGAMKYTIARTPIPNISNPSALIRPCIFKKQQCCVELELSKKIKCLEISAKNNINGCSFAK